MLRMWKSYVGTRWSSSLTYEVEHGIKYRMANGKDSRTNSAALLSPLFHVVMLDLSPLAAYCRRCFLVTCREVLVNQARLSRRHPQPLPQAGGKGRTAMDSACYSRDDLAISQHFHSNEAFTLSRHRGASLGIGFALSQPIASRHQPPIPSNLILRSQ